MPTFAYYGYYGCCSPFNNRWYSLFNASNASHLWLKDDTGRAVQLGRGGPRGSTVSYVYDLCSSGMLEFYKDTILQAFMEAPGVHGVFLDEVDSFVEGGGGNVPFHANPPPGTAPYVFSAARKANITLCWMDAMQEIVRHIALSGKFAIPSTNAYPSQYTTFYRRQRDALVAYGGFKFFESFCQVGGGWVCPLHPTRAACCLDQLAALMDHADRGVPTMVTIAIDPTTGDASALGLGAFLIGAQKWSYVAVGRGWNGPSSFPVVRAYGRKLGAPKGHAVEVEKGVFRRSFQFLDVVVNVTAGVSEFRWHGNGDERPWSSSPSPPLPQQWKWRGMTFTGGKYVMFATCYD